MKNYFLTLSTLCLLTISCNSDDTVATSAAPISKDINTAIKVSVDRFSATAGHLFVRTATNGLPVVNAPINFDNAPFITMGYDRTGAVEKYYNFDVQPTAPVDIYVFFKNGATTPVPGQNNVIPSIPGDAGYNDFWVVNKVTVPDNYVPNSITSKAEILASGYTIIKTNMIVNCPVVPFGSTAARSKTAGVSSALTLGWYQGKAVAYFEFNEASITATAGGMVPTQPIYVMFNINPSANDPASGPPSGFKVEAGTMQTHNVLATKTMDVNYSPLWSVQVLDNSNFASVTNLASASALTSMPAGANVNCPVVK
jgi:hypothetical protein